MGCCDFAGQEFAAGSGRGKNLSRADIAYLSFFSAAAAVFLSILDFHDPIWSPACSPFTVMDPLTSVAASGLRARMESLDLLANNVANASTGGYKADREFYSLYVSPDAQADPSSTMPVIERPWTDLSQGTLQPTGNSLDLALSGKGFFSVAGPHGTLYTRNGSFRLSPDGQLVTAEGYPVNGAGGKPSRQRQGPAPSKSPATAASARMETSIGQLQVADFPARRALQTGQQLFPRLRPVGAARGCHRHVRGAGQTGGFQQRHRRRGRPAGGHHAPVRDVAEGRNAWEAT